MAYILGHDTLIEVRAILRKGIGDGDALLDAVPPQHLQYVCVRHAKLDAVVHENVYRRCRACLSVCLSSLYTTYVFQYSSLHITRFMSLCVYASMRL